MKSFPRLSAKSVPKWLRVLMAAVMSRHTCKHQNSQTNGIAASEIIYYILWLLFKFTILLFVFCFAGNFVFIANGMLPLLSSKQHSTGRSSVLLMFVELCWLWLVALFAVCLSRGVCTVRPHNRHFNKFWACLRSPEIFGHASMGFCVVQCSRLRLPNRPSNGLERTRRGRWNEWRAWAIYLLSPSSGNEKSVPADIQFVCRE